MELPAVIAALADPVRFRIVEVLRSEPRHVSELVDLLGESQPNVSRHLKTLFACGLVDRAKEGKWVRYRVRPEALALVSEWASPREAATPGRRATSPARREEEPGASPPEVPPSERRVDRDAQRLFFE